MKYIIMIMSILGAPFLMLSQNNSKLSEHQIQNAQITQQNKDKGREMMFNRLDNMSAKLNQATSSLLNNAIQSAQINFQQEMQLRQEVVLNYFKSNQQLVAKLSQFYKSISNFYPLEDGLYEAYISKSVPISTYSLQEIEIIEPCIIRLNNMSPIEIYPYGIKELKLNIPQQKLMENTFQEGFYNYSDIRTLETFSLFLIEPFLEKNYINPELSSNKVTKLLLFSKKEQGKTAYIQELDNSGNLIRETKTIINDITDNNTNKGQFIYVLNGSLIKIYSEPKMTKLGTLNFIASVKPSDTYKEKMDGDDKIINVIDISKWITLGFYGIMVTKSYR